MGGQLRAAKNKIVELERELLEARGEAELASTQHEEELADLRGEIEELKVENERLADIVAHPGGDNGCGDVFDLASAEGDLRGIVGEAVALVKLAGQRKDDWLGIEVARGADEIRRVAAGLLGEVEGLLGRGKGGEEEEEEEGRTAVGGDAKGREREDAKDAKGEGEDGGEGEEPTGEASARARRVGGALC